MKIKVITGFRDDQYYVIDGEEAHKAYYLFNNPEKRGVFNNGVALVGRNIQGIEPAWNETMGWNPSHKPDGHDWNEIRKRGLKPKMAELLTEAKKVAYFVESRPELMLSPLSEAKTLLLEGKKK